MCVSKRKAIIWYDRTSVAQLSGWVKTQISLRSWVWVSDCSFQQMVWGRAYILSSVPLCKFWRGEEHFFALLIIMNNVNLRITNSISFFEGGDFLWSRTTTSYYVDFCIFYKRLKVFYIVTALYLFPRWIIDLNIYFLILCTYDIYCHGRC